MTDQTHLDDDALSAVLDGEGSVDDAAHADTCPACSSRLQVLRDASLLVRTPVPPAGAAERDAAIAAALASSSAATVTPIRPRRSAPRWLAAAAIIAIVAVAAFALGRNRDDGASDSATSASGGATTTVAGATAAPGAALAAPVDGGDVGEVQGSDLRATITAAMAAPKQERAAADASGSAGGGASAAADCETTIRSDNPALGPLVYRARGTYGGEPVSVFAFDASGRRWVYVVAIDGCALRNQTTYSV